MMRYINALTGKRHWYSVRFSYHTPGGNELFSWAAEVGVVRQGDNLHRREMKVLGSKRVREPQVKHLLCNGRIHMQVLCYLGKFKKPENCATAVTISGTDIMAGLLLGGYFNG